MEVGEVGAEAGGEGGARGECQDWTLWKDSTLDEKSDLDSTFLPCNGDGDRVRWPEGGLVIKESTGGAVIDLLKFCNAWGLVSFSTTGWYSSCDG